MEGYENFPVGKRRSKEVALAANIEESFGFDEKLSPAFSLRPANRAVPADTEALYPSAFGAVYAYAAGKLWLLAEGGPEEKGSFAAPPAYAAGFYEGEEADIFGDGGSLLFLTAGGSGVQENVSGRPLCGCRGSLVLADGGAVRVSAPFSPHEFSVGAGAWEWRVDPQAGGIVGGAEIGGSLYVFCERGVYRSTPDGYAREAEISRIPTDTEKICAFAAEIGRAYCFTSAGRLYMFDGDFRLLAEEATFKPSTLKACAFAGGCAVSVSPGRLLAYDAERQSVSRIAAEVSALGGRFALAGNGLTAFSRENAGGRVLSKPIDFGTRAPKKLARLDYSGRGRLSVGVISERGQKRFSLAEGESAYPKMSGRSFQFSVETEAGAEIGKITAVYTVIGEE